MALRGAGAIDTPFFQDKTEKEKKELKCSKILNVKIDSKKVVINVLKPWITEQINAIMGFDDDVLINLVFNLLEKSRYPDAKDMLLQLKPFLNDDTDVKSIIVFCCVVLCCLYSNF